MRKLKRSESPERGRRPSRKNSSARPSPLYCHHYTCLESFSIQNVPYPPPPIPCSTFSALGGRPPPATAEYGVLGLESARCRAQIRASACKKFEYFQIFSNVSHHFSNIFERFTTVFKRFQTQLAHLMRRPAKEILEKFPILH